MRYMEKDHISIDELKTDSIIHAVGEFIFAELECGHSKIEFIKKTINDLFYFEDAEKEKTEKLIPLLKLAVNNGSWIVDESEIELRISESKQIIKNLLAVL